jgi:hypothetical protein
VTLLGSEDGTRAAGFDVLGDRLEMDGIVAPLRARKAGELLPIEVYVDHSLVEIYADDGRICLTHVVAEPPGTGRGPSIAPFVGNGAGGARRFEVRPVRSIWSGGEARNP